MGRVRLGLLDVGVGRVGSGVIDRLSGCTCMKVLEGDTGRVSPTQRMSLLTGTFPYRAPELLRGESPDTKADIYSLGITLWQMESRQTPYAGHEPHAVVFNVVAYNARPSVRDNTQTVSTSRGIRLNKYERRVCVLRKP